jgi:hypothetical protein
MNTFDKGQVRTLVYRDKASGVWYGTALEFNLTIDGEDKNIVVLELDRAIKDYVHSARQLGAIELLNQTTDPELDHLWQAHINNLSENLESPYQSHFAGTERLVHG